MNIIESEDAEASKDAYVAAIESRVRKFCKMELNWTFDEHSYSVMFDPDENELRLVPDTEEVTFDELKKLSRLGNITIAPGSKAYTLNITIKTMFEQPPSVTNVDTQ